MAKIIPAPGILSIHGRLGDAIFYNVKGNQYMRSYSIPFNPGTKLQQDGRTSFGKVSKLWKLLSAEEQSWYNLQAVGKPFTGFNLFVSMTLKGIKHEPISADQSELTGITFVYDSYMLRDTSVLLRQEITHADERMQGSEIILKKPPGELERAA